MSWVPHDHTTRYEFPPKIKRRKTTSRVHEYIIMFHANFLKAGFESHNYDVGSVAYYFSVIFYKAVKEIKVQPM